MARQAAARLTGTEVPNHVVFRLGGMKEVVDAMGGVRVDAGAGPLTLNGDEALAYFYAGDGLLSYEERAEHQQAFLYEVLRQALGPSNLLSNPTTLKAVLENIETNMNGLEMFQLLGRVRALDEADAPIRVESIPGRGDPASSSK